MTTKTRTKLPDASTRAVVANNLSDTIFLEAGAGSGKTSCLVDRFVALVEAGVPGDTIAAITFTEQAAAELADRIRRALHARNTERCGAALEVLDRAAICTLHSFAQRILVAHPIEAGIPPRVQVLDEITSEIAFARRWDNFVDRLLEDPELERPIRMLAECGDVLSQLRDLALAFGDNWDLVQARLDDPRYGVAASIPQVDVTGWCDDVDALEQLTGDCVSADDGMVKRIGDLAAYSARLRNAADEEAQFGVLLRGAPSFKVGTTGNKTKWRSRLDEARKRVIELGARHEELVKAVAQSCARRMAQVIGEFTVDSAKQRRADGRLEFHDLLVLARDVLRHPEHGWEVRSALRDRYQRLLLDEFQDTDPIQIELAVLIASADPEARSKAWDDVEVEAGRLFVVGDPKQSIYRFRRADIRVFLDARASLVDAPEQLTANFRTVKPIVEWVNATFSTLIQEDEGSQPAYVGLEWMRAAPPASSKGGPPVALLGPDPHADSPNAETLRAREAGDVADAIVRAVQVEHWLVADGADGAWRPAGWADVCILLPARTSLPALERALTARDVPYRAETSSLVYATREVRDLLAVVRAVEDPTDALAIVTALRSPAFGCGDDDLYTWKIVHNGRFDHQWRGLLEALADDRASHPVCAGLAWMGELHRERAWLSPSQILDRIVRDRRLMQVAFASARPRDLLRRLRFVVDQARAWQEAGGGSLRDYLTWVELQSMDSSRVVETVLPETDDESVRIMTVHGAKGLEFPITVLSGMTTQMRGRQQGVEVRFTEGEDWEIKLGKDIKTAEFEANKPRDEQMDHDERLRLLYVAATRARDHLIVSAHRKPPKPGNNFAQNLPTSGELFWHHGNHPHLVTVLQPVFDLWLGGWTQPTPDSAPLVPRAEWANERSAALRAGTRRLSVSATRIAEELAAALDPGLAKGPRDLDLPPWQKGRYGTAIGRAVHGVLQTVDLSTGEGMDGAVGAQAAAEGVLGHEPTIEALVRSALDSSIVKAAATRPHWREVYVGIPVPITNNVLGALTPEYRGERAQNEVVVLEGYIDLLYRDDDGLVIVDYKTDLCRSDAEREAKLTRYGPQLAAYAHALQEVTGEPVARAIALFLAPTGAAGAEVPDLGSAVAQIPSLVPAPE